MNLLPIAFYLSAGIAFLTLFWRIIRAKNFSQRAPFYLFLACYLALLTYPFLWLDAPTWLFYSNGVLFLAGTLWFIWEPIKDMIQKYRELGRHLKELKSEKGTLYEIVAACRQLSQARLGALMAIQRNQTLETWLQKGILIDANVSRELLFSIFTPPGAVHDGATLLTKNRLVSAGVIFPLTQAPHFPKELGTRHRAALGFSEVSDALCVVVSEESGCVSLADQGALYYNIPFEKLPEFLELGLKFKLRKNKALLQPFELAAQSA